MTWIQKLLKKSNQSPSFSEKDGRARMKKTVILISGWKGSGKDHGGRIMKDYLNSLGKSVSMLKFATDLKNLTNKSMEPLAELFDQYITEFNKVLNETRMPLENRAKFSDIINRLKILPKNFYEDKTDITRILLQVVGTDVAHFIDKEFWARRVVDKVDKKDDDFFIITDTRFPREIELFEEYGFFDDVNLITLRINPTERKIDRADAHVSENALNNYRFMFTTNNNFDEEFSISIRTIIDKILEDYE